MALAICGGVKKILIWPDTHVPYEDKQLFKLMLEIVAHTKPWAIVFLGDFGDFYAVSSHDKNPKRKLNLKWEVDCVNARLDQVQKVAEESGVKKVWFIEGNHEWRLDRYLASNAPALFDFFKVKDLFRIGERGWTFVPYKDHVQIGKVYFTHDTGKAGARAHKQSGDDFQDNVVIGHTHRMGYMIEGNAKGKPHVYAMCGWLGDLKQVDYMHRIKALRDWSHGFAMGYMEPDDNMHIQLVPIVDGKCLIGGQVVGV